MRPTISLMTTVVLLVGNVAHADSAVMSGKELYGRFCSSCHGVTGRGDGPVAASFKVEVPDLTFITRRAGGVFPRERIVRIIDGRHVIGAHGTRTMPIWGEDLSRLEIGTPNSERAARMAIDALADYVGQLQKPAQR
jgi:mono/diheme cytochrome c family protein